MRKRSYKLPCRLHPGQSFAAAILFLLAVAVQFALPTFHLLAENALETAQPISESFSGSSRTSESLAGVKIHHHHHNPYSCPICQAFQLAHNIRAGAVSSTQTILEPVDRISSDNFYPNIAAVFSSNSSPRSPPLSA